MPGPGAEGTFAPRPKIPLGVVLAPTGTRSEQRMKRFEYTVGVEWTGNDGTGTSTSRFGRDNEISAHAKPTIVGSAPAEFGGDGVDWSPEELFVASISQCHMLTYLFLCSRAGIIVDSYVDHAVGVLQVEGASGGKFAEVELRPEVVISAGKQADAIALHDAASAGCFVSNSVSCPVKVNGFVHLWE